MSTSQGEITNRFAVRTKQPEDPVLKSLRIKVGGLKRNLKDLEFAQKEVIQEASRLQSLKQSNPDRVKQQESVLSEAQMMVPHSQNRIRAAIKDLEDFLASGEVIDKDNEIVQSASETLAEAERVLSEA